MQSMEERASGGSRAKQ